MVHGSNQRLICGGCWGGDKTGPLQLSRRHNEQQATVLSSSLRHYSFLFNYQCQCAYRAPSMLPVRGEPAVATKANSTPLAHPIVNH